MYAGGSAGSLYILSPESASRTGPDDAPDPPDRAPLAASSSTFALSSSPSSPPFRTEKACRSDCARDCISGGAYHGARDTSVCGTTRSRSLASAGERDASLLLNASDSGVGGSCPPGVCGGWFSDGAEKSAERFGESSGSVDSGRDEGYPVEGTEGDSVDGGIEGSAEVANDGSVYLDGLPSASEAAAAGTKGWTAETRISH